MSGVTSRCRQVEHDALRGSLSTRKGGQGMATGVPGEGTQNGFCSDGR